MRQPPAYGRGHRADGRRVARGRGPVRPGWPTGSAGALRTSADGRGDALHRPDRLPVALPARAVPALGGRLEPVAALARQRGLGPCYDPARPRGAPAARSQRRPFDGHDRRPDGEGRTRWPDVPRGRRTGRLHRDEADHPDRDPRAAARRPGRFGQAPRRALRPAAPQRPPRRASTASRRSSPTAAIPASGRSRRGSTLALDIKRPPKLVPPPVLPGQKPKKPKRVFTPLAPLYKVENAFARLGRWRRLSRCYEGSARVREDLARSRLRRLPVRAAPGRADVTGGRPHAPSRGPPCSRGTDTSLASDHRTSA